MADPLHEELPESLEASLLLFRRELYFATGAFYTSSSSAAAMSIFNHATNDILDLAQDCLDGRGRTAARSARALYEHAVNFREVSTDSASAERYEDHRWCTEAVLDARRPGLTSLTAPVQRKRRRKYDAASRRISREFGRVVTAYGPSFKRAWHPSTLYDLSVKHKLEDEYDAYRLLSTVVHGSAGGLTGTAEAIDQSRVHRTGVNLKLASLAWLEGFGFFWRFADSLPLTSSMDAKPLKDATQALLAEWPAIDESLRRVDRKLWPTEAPVQDFAILAIFPGSRTRWYYYHTATEEMALADPPLDAVAREADFRLRLSDVIADYRPEAWGGRPLTGSLSDVTVRPQAGCQWFPAHAILPPRERMIDLIEQYGLEERPSDFVPSPAAVSETGN